MNQTYSDPVLRKIFRDKRFRIALSHALNRDEINEILYLGLAKPVQATVHPEAGHSYYEEAFATTYIKYDPKKANRLLDEMGLRRGQDGYRLRPDGKRLNILLEYHNFETPKRQICGLARKYWHDIGLKTEPKEITGDLHSTPEGRKDIIGSMRV